MELKEIMEAFAAEAGLEDVTADGDGTYALSIDEMVVSFAEDSEAGRLVTFAEVGDTPAEGCERFYRLLLETMYRGEATGGATFSVPPDSDLICLQRFDSLENMDLAGFKAMLESFVNVLEDWKKSLADFREISPSLNAAKSEKAAEARELGLGTNGFMQV